MGIGSGNPLFIFSSVRTPSPSSRCKCGRVACDLHTHHCPQLAISPSGTEKRKPYTIRYLKHPSHPLQTPHSSCKNTTILKKNRPTGGSLSTIPAYTPKFPFQPIGGFLNRNRTDCTHLRTLQRRCFPPLPGVWGMRRRKERRK